MKALGMMVVIFGSLVRNECKKNKDKMFLKNKAEYKAGNTAKGWFIWGQYCWIIKIIKIY